jgi:putative membrane protein
MSTEAVLLHCWRWDPLAILVALLALVSYLLGTRASLHPRAPYLAAAVAVVVLAVASPVGTLSDGYLFSAHMLQHLLLVLVVPPLLLLGMGGSLRSEREARKIGRPIPVSSLSTWAAWGLGVGAMWLWHAPTLCNAASQSGVVHRVQEVSLMVMGTAYWWPILSPRRSDRLTPLRGIVYLFTACIACTILGIAVTLSPVEVCSVYLHPVDRLGILPLLRSSWGLTADRDQELGGLLMWMPACLVYGGGILGLLGRWYGGDRASLRPRTSAVTERA